MKVSTYLNIAHKTDGLPANLPEENINPRLGLAGEIGYLLTALKKEVRDDAPTADATRATVKDELGDIVWYAVTIAKRAKLDFQKDVLLGNLRRVQANYTDVNKSPAPLLERVLEPGGDVSKAIRKGARIVSSFGAYQKLAMKTSKFKTRKGLVPFLVNIWKNAGDLLNEFGAAAKDTDTDNVNVAQALGDVMWYVAGFALVYGLDLDDVMAANAEKIVSAFPAKDQKVRTNLFDEGLGPLRQFPRNFNVDFVDEQTKTAFMFINGVRVGDPLTDNSRELDGYRFHDAVHLAFVAVLGWSPVMRSLMRCKRKGVGDLDEVEDGARAQIVEEMVVKIAHSYAVGLGGDDLLDRQKHVNLNLLKDIRALAEGLEVSGGRPGVPGCKYWEWQEAILSGFRVYNQLRQNKGGRVAVDLKGRKITFQKLKSGQGTRMLLAKP